MHIDRYTREEVLAMARRLRVRFIDPAASATLPPPKVPSVMSQIADRGTNERRTP